MSKAYHCHSGKIRANTDAIQYIVSSPSQWVQVFRYLPESQVFSTPEKSRFFVYLKALFFYMKPIELILNLGFLGSFNLYPCKLYN
jgi:hypothetical protein